MLPTHVGMDRPSCGNAALGRHAPHARGDGPGTRATPSLRRACSPRTWGWTDIRGDVSCALSMLPTHVGMDREITAGRQLNRDAPHARGDGPEEEKKTTKKQCSPRTWGWTEGRQPTAKQVLMLPTHVGMDRRYRARPQRAGHAPHARGDGPWDGPLAHIPILCSPRTWGWTGEVRPWPSL